MSALVDQFLENAVRNGLVVHRGEAPAIDGAVCSEALYALADPGSVVLAASPSEPRARSILPAIHIACVSEDRILAGLPDLLEAIRDELPSGLVIVSGPSRSADIEQMLATGVHGPREQHVVVVAARDAANAKACSGLERSRT